MKLQLPDVTLVMIETRSHRLAQLAVQDCLNRADFGDVIICSNQFNELRFPHSAKYVLVADWPEKVQWSEFSWYGVATLIKTKFQLHIQWDSWIVQPQAWKPEFLHYDFIGAPWETNPLSVGNGGFSLRSKRLTDYLLEHCERFPVTTDRDDVLLSRTYRPELEQAGFTWAPVELAKEFSWERSYAPKAFGFHGAFRFADVLADAALDERVQLLAADPAVNGSVAVRELFRNLKR